MENVEKEASIKPLFVFPVFLSKVAIFYTILFVTFLFDAMDGDVDDGYLDSNFYITTSIMALVLAVTILPFFKALLRNTTYTFTKRDIVCKRSFPFSSRVKIPYSIIKDISVKQSWLHKMFDIGALLITTDTNNKYCFYSLKQAPDICDLIIKMCKKNSSLVDSADLKSDEESGKTNTREKAVI